VTNKREPVTIELGLYGFIVAFGLVVRLFRLAEGAPLSTGEAALALAALRGTPPPVGTSPLLYSANSILFALLSAGDGLARLIPAFAGAALVAMPALWRERIGRTGALGAALLLAISPVAIMTSRTMRGDAIVACVLIGLAVIADRYLRTGRTAWLYGGMALLGFGLASGQTIYSALLMLLASAGAMAFAGGADIVHEKWQAVRATPGLIGRLLGTLVAVFVVSATALMWRPGGLSAAIDLLSAWLADFRAGTTGWPWAFQVLAIYEPLTVVVGLAGLVFALQRNDRFILLPVAWLIVAILLAVLRPGRTTGDVLLMVIPFALLGGYTFQALQDSLRTTRFSREEGILVLVLLPIIAYFALGLAAYAQNPNSMPLVFGSLQIAGGASITQIFLALVLMVILVTLFSGLTGGEAALRGATSAVLLVLALATWAAGWNAAQNRPGDPREIIVGSEATSPAVHKLVYDLKVLSAQKTTNPHLLDLFVLGGSPSDAVLKWYLRDMPNAHFVAGLDVSSAPEALVTTGLEPPALPGSYAGERFTLQQTWNLGDRPASDILKWIIYRSAETPRPTQQVILWVKQ
jgi:uncharacterized protein (TIGR03663 family)